MTIRNWPGKLILLSLLTGIWSSWIAIIECWIARDTGVYLISTPLWLRVGSMCAFIISLGLLWFEVLPDKQWAKRLLMISGLSVILSAQYLEWNIRSGDTVSYRLFLLYGGSVQINRNDADTDCHETPLWVTMTDINGKRLHFPIGITPYKIHDYKKLLDLSCRTIDYG